MKEFEHAIEAAKTQIPAAFELGGPLPFADEVRPLAGEGALATDDLLPAEDERIEDVAQANEELGMEALAFYVSFHGSTPEGQWGIFYFETAVRQLAAKIMRDLRGWLQSDRSSSLKLAREVVRRHELFHFRFDVYALQQEMALRRPLYNHYHKSVYRRVYCTEECYEEALANRACAYDSPAEVQLALIQELQPLAERPETEPGRCYVSPYGHIDDPCVFCGQWSPSSSLANLVINFCRKAPPGYRDFERPEEYLRASLGGQLLGVKTRVPKLFPHFLQRYLPARLGSQLLGAATPLAEPQWRWVGYAGPFAKRAHCPEHILIDRGSPREVPRLRWKRGGWVWTVHKSDSDPWPSTPHGHDYGQHAKLHIGDGSIFDARTRQRISRLSRRDLQELHDRLRYTWPGIALPSLEV